MVNRTVLMLMASIFCGVMQSADLPLSLLTSELSVEQNGFEADDEYGSSGEENSSDDTSESDYLGFGKSNSTETSKRKASQQAKPPKTTVKRSLGLAKAENGTVDAARYMDYKNSKKQTSASLNLAFGVVATGVEDRPMLTLKCSRDDCKEKKSFISVSCLDKQGPILLTEVIRRLKNSLYQKGGNRLLACEHVENDVIAMGNSLRKGAKNNYLVDGTPIKNAKELWDTLSIKT